MTENRVSVLLTFYNQEEYVDTAIESVLSQKTDFGVKLIVGDDGSTDGTCAAVNNWIERYPDMIELHVMERGTGVSIPGFRASRNRLNLLKYVDTEYFIFLDGDDRFTNEFKLQKQVGILDLEENKDCIACGHNTYRLYDNGTRIPMTDKKLPEGKLTLKRYWSNYHIHTDSLLMRSLVIADIDQELLENEYNDNMITLSAFQHGMIYYFPEVWAEYVQTNKGLWTSEKETVNLIRNMIFYDLSCRIDPGIRMQSLNRFSYVWKNLYKIRKQLVSAELSAYYSEAKEKHCKNAEKWARYSELSRFQRAGLGMKTFMIVCLAPFLRRLF